jgi:hypothetical protein
MEPLHLHTYIHAILRKEVSGWRIPAWGITSQAGTHANAWGILDFSLTGAIRRGQLLASGWKLLLYANLFFT